MNVLITGASKGLGFELVKQFAANKDNDVIALSRDLERLNELKEFCELNYDNLIHVYSIDFLSLDFKKELDAILIKHNHHFDVVVNNAGYLINKPFLETSLKNAEKIFKVNVFGPIQVMQSVIPLLDKDKDSHMVNIGSMGGVQGSVKFPGLSIYSSSKAALASLTECLAEEYKDSNVKFNCLALGSVDTEMLADAFPGFKAGMTSEAMSRYVYEFSRIRPIYYNGKILPVSNSTP